MSDALVSTFAILALGAWHGINPGMGWLFAVALGFQEGKARAVWRALPPLAVGHALAVAAAVMVAVLLRTVLNPAVLKLLVAASLFALGVSRLVRARHPRYGGMVVGPLDLTVWSALMASAHGAGLMVVPFVTGVQAHHAHAAHAVEMSGMTESLQPAIEVAALHTASYLLVSAVVAFAVYGWFGVRLLRTRWVNLDLIWAGALIVTAAVSAGG
jgi:hypothetical protein